MMLLSGGSSIVRLGGDVLDKSASETTTDKHTASEVQAK